LVSRGGQLENKVAIVTGGASGIGEGICHEFAAEGAIIAIADININSGQRVAEKIQQQGAKAIAVEVDVANYQQVREVVASILQQLGTIDILINCAGVSAVMLPEDVTPEQWRHVVSINLDGTWYFCQAVMPEMMRKKSGKIINIGSAAGILGAPKLVQYSSSKAAVIELTRSLAVDLGGDNINVNCICPSTVLTPLFEKTGNPVFKTEMVKRTPLGRLGKPSDIAKAAIFLASPDSDWITGVILPVDGGLTCCFRAHHWE